jgi:signal transduction histidine kinase
VVAAADAERRRVERDLHDGAQQRLLALGVALQLLRDDRDDTRLLAEAEAELRAALRELRELARGIHPTILSDSGLGGAVAGLVDRAPIPVSARVTVPRQPEAVESTAYFIVSEALANVTKHAHAHAANVSITSDDGRLVVEVSDDGCGGADAASGSGLQGLADRVGALDGTFTIATAPGCGTAIRAEIPCASS